jgi:hypothetical protein
MLLGKVDFIGHLLFGGHEQMGSVQAACRWSRLAADEL